MTTSESSAKQPEIGLQCRSCGCRHLPVQATRQDAKRIIRYRICRFCGRRHRTIERLG